ncbi:hypothetical protein CNO09_07350 (plasmid) [Borrelia miyamotoi]|uniref:Uncharacterized protein n=1 Tax=Borrelia miyamotoi FR64b TaxID=1292392 RepID=W5SEM3_9SPIR|nr:hypothetical protein [Borrelia miyamotoi]AHH05569.1 Hypothetical protein BOM_1026 [Borrelia miyamotoi FR64b]WAZ71031.1 hypothetical protein O5403_05065 [Borrelia miyamotoi]WCB91024.1 hypothetical protein CNO11_07220 [Borrelia miyamotoi]WCL22152.1 hypothetical protein CNO10_07250 [Borrelia miyamotoi]WDS47260.1 hypothetical protein EZU72_007450 [Borrelia miyamotoi]
MEAVLKLKQYTKTHRENKALFSGFENGFQNKMQIINLMLSQYLIVLIV